MLVLEVPGEWLKAMTIQRTILQVAVFMATTIVFRLLLIVSLVSFTIIGKFTRLNCSSEHFGTLARCISFAMMLVACARDDFAWTD